MTAKTFLLGVGCQKGGTTWLHQYLHHHPQVNMGFAKEYHFFDALYLGNGKNIMRNAFDEGAQLCREFPNHDYDGELLRRLDFYLKPQHYFDYFKHLAFSDSGVNVVGDITPAYAGLSDTAFAEIKMKLESAGFQVKVIFIMREPVERIWSAIRMHRKLYPEQFFVDGEEITDDQAVSKRFNMPAIEMRTRYELTCKNLNAVFPAQDIHYELYERLTAPSRVQQLCTFLGIHFQRANIEVKVNTSEKSSVLTPQTMAKTRDYYCQTYAAAKQLFGENTLLKHWRL